MVPEVRAYTGEVFDEGDGEAVEEGGRAEAGALEDGGGAERTGGEDD